MPIDSLLDLSGEVAVVTGAGAGIGRAIAERLAEAGASVLVSDLDPATAEEVATSIGAAGGSAAALACDVTREDQREAVVKAAVDAFGRVTILVNNAGGGGPQPFDMALATFEWAFELNVFAGFHFSQLCAPHMEAAGHGAIVNVSSMAGENKDRNMTSYAASKAAVNHLTRNMAFDLGPKGVRVNAIAPGATRTHALETVLTTEIETRMLKHTPLGRLGDPGDMANAVLFLVSPMSAWVSGQILTVSGGGTQELD